MYNKTKYRLYWKIKLNLQKYFSKYFASYERNNQIFSIEEMQQQKHFPPPSRSRWL